MNSTTESRSLSSPARWVSSLPPRSPRADPLSGVGCGFAFQTAEWLCDCVQPALDGRADMSRALNNYTRQHQRMLGGYHFVMKDYLPGRRLGAFEALRNAAGARDPVCASHLVAFGSRNISLRQFIAPSVIARALWVNARHAMGRSNG